MNRINDKQENSHKNLLLLEKCISLLNLKEHSIAYVSCSKKKHVTQVIERNKEYRQTEKYKEIKAKNNHVTAAGIPFAVTLTELMKEKVK